MAESPPQENPPPLPLPLASLPPPHNHLLLFPEPPSPPRLLPPPPPSTHNVGPIPRKRKQSGPTPLLLSSPKLSRAAPPEPTSDGKLQRHGSNAGGAAATPALTLRRSPRLLSAPPGPATPHLGLPSAKTRKGAGRSLPLKNGRNIRPDLDAKSASKKQLGPLTSLLSSSQGSENGCPLEMNPNPVLESPDNSNCTSVYSKCLNSKAKKSRGLDPEILLLTWRNKDDDEPTAAPCSDLNATNQKCLRRSPRFTSVTETAADKQSAQKFTTVPMQDEKRIKRSTRQSCKASDSQKILIRSHLHDSSHNSDRQLAVGIRNSTENPSIRSLGDKCLRLSPGTANSILRIDENGEVNHVLTSLPDSIKEEAPIISGNLKKKTKYFSSKKKYKGICYLIGKPIPSDEAEERWHWRYELKSQRSVHQRCTTRSDDQDDEDKIIWNVEFHYSQANIAGTIFSLGDCAYVKGEGNQKHIGRVIEFFRTTEGEDYFRVQWFYKAEETVMKEAAGFHDKRRLFYSTVMNDNPIDCIISKVTVTQIPTGIASVQIPKSDFYYDMEYCIEYSTFRILATDDFPKSYMSSSVSSVDSLLGTSKKANFEHSPSEIYKTELSLLDLFSGCGGMSTGLCFGARLSGINLMTRWALDIDKSACESLKLNHPEAHVRNEAADNFFKLLKEWKKLCDQYAVDDMMTTQLPLELPSESEDDESSSNDTCKSSDEFEVERLLDIRYGDPTNSRECGLKFKVRWKGYDSSEDTWEPLEGLSDCQERVREFVRHGFQSKILPLPGEVDVICGGPPCQGISGYNRFRNVDSPLDDERNRQIVVFMDIVQFLKPRYVLMENVLDILRFDKASLGRYALSRLVHMKYQARLGIMAAGCYGLPQFRLRVFLWGSHPSEKLPQFPLPTHDVIVKYWPPPEFERNMVAYDEEQPRELEKAAVLSDAISDLPSVTSLETCEKMAYKSPPETHFQAYIRSSKLEMNGGSFGINKILYDHRPYSLTEEDYARVCLIPKRKGANFRDLPGVVVGANNVVRRDKTKEPVMLPSGKPLVPDFAFTFEQGKSKRPYARLWWDETVSTIVTYPDLHSMAVVHPDQDRVLTLRECARLQGFPDYYRFCGTIKERYRQVGNAVAVPVGRALGYALGMAIQKISGDEPSMKLPPKFAYSTKI